MSDSVRAFYDELAADYHRLFADWRVSIAYQAEVIGRLITETLGEGPRDVLDAACGIGTQAIGLARLGYRVRASDLSAAAVARLHQEATVAGLPIESSVADLRTLSEQIPGDYDAVIAFDNALPHLLTEADLRAAVGGVAAKLRPGGLLLASTRDYDKIAKERPRGEGPRVFDRPEGRRIAFQVWDWADDGTTYQVHQFIVQPEGAGWRTEHFTTVYRVLRRAELAQAARTAGLIDVGWLEPETSGYYQPIISARTSST
jgi:glycine/sarcosine N-methyltransferase